MSAHYRPSLADSNMLKVWPKLAERLKQLATENHEQWNDYANYIIESWLMEHRSGVQMAITEDSLLERNGSDFDEAP